MREYYLKKGTQTRFFKEYVIGKTLGFKVDCKTWAEEQKHGWGWAVITNRVISIQRGKKLMMKLLDRGYTMTVKGDAEV